MDKAGSQNSMNHLVHRDYPGPFLIFFFTKFFFPNDICLGRFFLAVQTPALDGPSGPSSSQKKSLTFDHFCPPLHFCPCTFAPTYTFAPPYILSRPTFLSHTTLLSRPTPLSRPALVSLHFCPDIHFCPMLHICPALHVGPDTFFPSYTFEVMATRC